MASELRQRFRETLLPEAQENGQHEFQELTGINIETDIDHVVAALDASGSSTPGAPGHGVVLARGQFAESKIEALMREHGAQVEVYKEKRLITTIKPQFNVPTPTPGVAAPQNPPQSFSLTFMEPGLVALGTTDLVRHAIDLHNGGGQSALTNEGLMARVKALDSGNVWAVGRFDVLRARANLPEAVADRLPPITWFAVTGHVDGGLAAVLSAEARDAEAAQNLRDVVRGFLALAKLQLNSKPEFQRFVDSLEIKGTGTTVALSLEVPAGVFEVLSKAMPKPPSKKE